MPMVIRSPTRRSCAFSACALTSFFLRATRLTPRTAPADSPHGFKAVADEIHALGLKSGLYTAKGPNTCARFAASCDHEVEDAAQWAACVDRALSRPIIVA